MRVPSFATAIMSSFPLPRGCVLGVMLTQNRPGFLVPVRGPLVLLRSIVAETTIHQKILLNSLVPRLRTRYIRLGGCTNILR